MEFVDRGAVFADFRKLKDDCCLPGREVPSAKAPSNREVSESLKIGTLSFGLFSYFSMALTSSSITTRAAFKKFKTACRSAESLSVLLVTLEVVFCLHLHNDFNQLYHCLYCDCAPANVTEITLARNFKNSKKTQIHNHIVHIVPWKKVQSSWQSCTGVSAILTTQYDPGTLFKDMNVWKLSKGNRCRVSIMGVLRI